MVELDIKIGAGDLYDYMLRHHYNSPAGLMGSILGAIMIMVAIPNKQWIFLIASTEDTKVTPRPLSEISTACSELQPLS